MFLKNPFVSDVAFMIAIAKCEQYLTWKITLNYALPHALKDLFAKRGGGSPEVKES